MNILILGGAGFLGNNLIRRCLQEEKHTITVVDSFDKRLKSDKSLLDDISSRITLIQGDIKDFTFLKEQIKGQDVIFNCAAQTSHPMSFVDPFFDVEVNCLGNITLLEAARQFNRQALIIYTSSSTVIGKAVGEVVSESHGELPLDIYSANKGVAEKYYYIYNRVHDLNTLVLRFANLYGPYGKGYPEFGFINYFISLAASGQEISIYGEGNQTRNVMYVEDACDLLYRCISHKKIFGDVYFAAHREHYAIRQIAQDIVDVFGRGKITHIDWPDLKRRIEINNVIISGAKLFYELQWEPRYTLHEGLTRTKAIMDQYQRKAKTENRGK